MVVMEFSNVSLEIDDCKILREINLVFGARRIGIIGVNGSGKSTLVRLINGLHFPSNGCVKVDRIEVNKKTVKQIRRMVGFVFQNPQTQLVMPEVREDLKFGLKNMGIQNIESAIEEVSVMLGIQNLLGRNTYQLSGGEKQMVALATILVTKPKVLVFDEPTTYLDLMSFNRLSEIVNTLPQQIITISHNLDLIQTCNQVILMDQGQVAYDGSPKNAIAKYRELCKSA